MDWYYLLNSFNGRIGRKTFWIAFGTVLGVEILFDIVAYRLEGERLSAIVDLAFTYPEFAIAAKRGQDRNMPLWVLAIFFGTGVFLDLLTVLGIAGSSDNPNLIARVIGFPLMVFGLALLADLGLRRGTVGPNRYGPDPLAGT